MKYCAKCGTAMDDNIFVCPSCGQQRQGANEQAAPNGQQVPPYGQPYVVNPFDHTAEMDAKDISENKVIAMLPYLCGLLGVFFCAILAKDSKYSNFHVRQMLKISVCEILLSIITLILCWTVIVPIAAAVCAVILFVVRIIGFFHVCGGKAVELPIVRGFGFLK